MVARLVADTTVRVESEVPTESTLWMEGRLVGCPGDGVVRLGLREELGALTVAQVSHRFLEMTYGNR